MADIIDQLVEKKLIRNISDLYSLKRDDLISLERMAEKSADNLLDAIEKSKKKSLANLIYGLEIRYVGVHTSEVVTRHYPTLDKFKKKLTYKKDVDRDRFLGALQKSGLK